MNIEKILWNEDTIVHIARHGVDPDEVEETCFSRNTLILKSKLGRYIALGQTHSGRYLTMVFKYAGRKQAIIITARAMSESERKLYQNRR